MYTRCPECKTAYRIDPKQLRAGHGQALCDRCHIVFDALASLAMTVKESSVVGPVRLVQTPVLGDQDAVVLPRFERDRLGALDSNGIPELRAEPRGLAAESRRLTSSNGLPIAKAWVWAGGAALLAILLVCQILAFEGRRLAQNVHTRPFMESLCSTLGCTLQPFRDVANLQILDRTLTLAGRPKDGFEFSLVFANQSDLPQAYPRLRLVLNQLDGRPAAERLFEPAEYLPDWSEGSRMLVGVPVEISLFLARPSREIGGFAIEFL